MKVIYPITSEDVFKTKKLRDLKKKIDAFTKYEPVIDNILSYNLEYHEWVLRAVGKVSAVYFLISNDEIIYVGQTKDMCVRMLSHSRNKTFDSIKYLETEPKKLIELEEYYIIALQPRDNNTICDKIKANKKRYDFIKAHADNKTLRKHKIK